MALFRYKALSSTGESLDGQMEAGSADEVVVRLQDQGYLPVEARRADEGGSGMGQIEEAARAAGMRTMYEDGLVKAMQGITTIEEVLRVTQEG